MKSKKTMLGNFKKTIISLLLTFALSVTVLPHYKAAQADYQLQGLKNPDGSPVYGINYTPVHIYGWLPSVMSGEYYVPGKLEEELTHIKSMGFNSVRLLPTFYDGLYSLTDAEFTNILVAYEERYRELLGICRKLGLTADVGMLPIPENGGDYQTEGGKIEKTLEMFVKRIGVDFQDVIVLWEISNEPDVNTWGLNYEDSVQAFKNDQKWNSVTKPFLESAASYMDKFYEEVPEYKIPYSIGCMNSARCDEWDSQNMDVLNIHDYNRTIAQTETFMNEAYALDTATLGRVRPVVLSEVMMSGMYQPADDIVDYCIKNNISFYIWGYSAISFEQGFQGLVDLTEKMRISTLPLSMIPDANEAFPMSVPSYDLTAGGLNEYHTALNYMNSVINNNSDTLAEWEDAVEHFYNWVRYMVPYATESFHTLYALAGSNKMAKLKYIADLGCAMVLPYIRTYGTYQNDNALGGSESADYYESFTRYNTNDGMNVFRSRFAFGEGKDKSKAILMQGYNSLTVRNGTTDLRKIYSFSAELKPLTDSGAELGVMCRQDDQGENPGMYFRVTRDVSDAVKASASMNDKIKPYSLLVYGVSDQGVSSILKEITLSESDFDNDGFLSLRVDYTGLGTSQSPLTANVYINGTRRFEISFKLLNSTGAVLDCYPSLNTPNAMGAYFDNIILKNISDNSTILSDSFETGKYDYDYLVYDPSLNLKQNVTMTNSDILNLLDDFRNKLDIKESVFNAQPEIKEIRYDGESLIIDWIYGGSGEYGFEIQKSSDNGRTWKSYWRTAPDDFSAIIPVSSLDTQALYRVCAVTENNSVVKPSQSQKYLYNNGLIPGAAYSFEDSNKPGLDACGNYPLSVSDPAKSLVTTEETGVVGKAVHFGMLDSYNPYLYTNDILEGKADFTVMSYAKLDSDATNENYTIFSNGWQNDGGLSFGFSGDEWMYICADASGGDWLAFNLKTVTQDSDFNAHDWHAYALTLKNGRVLQVYIDGKAVFSYTFNEEINTVNEQSYFTLGSTYNGGYHLAGSLDEVKVFLRPLSEGEIADCLHQTKSSQLISYYAFQCADTLGMDQCGTYQLTSHISGTVNYEPVGVSDGAVHFSREALDGDLHLYNESDALDGETDFTVSAFAKLDEGEILTGDMGILFSNGGWSNSGISFGFNTSEWFIVIVNGNNDVGFKFNEKIPGYDAYKWHHYAVTVSDGKNLRVYIDGAEMLSVVYQNPINATDSTTPCVLGSAFNGGYAFPGCMDEVKLYSSALSQGEIDRLCQLDAPYSKAPIAEYRFDNFEDIGEDRFGVNFLTNCGNVTVSEDAVFGKSAAFSGNDWQSALQCYDYDFTDSLSEITFTCFAKYTAEPSGNMCLLSTGWDPAGGISFGLASGGYVFLDAVSGDEVVWRSVKADIQINEWHYYSVSVADGGKTIRIAVDGITLLSFGLENPIIFRNSNQKLTVGQSSWLGGYAFVGLIDDMRIYDYGMENELLLADYRYTTYKTKGDINADGAVNIRDLVSAKKYFSGVGVYTCIRNLDMNYDYILEAADMLILRKNLLGINIQ